MGDTRMNLYRHFNSEGQLLYVGISNSTLIRLGAHKANAHWFDSITNVTIEKCTDREDALAKEAKAIKTEHPMHNTIHKQKLTGRHFKVNPDGSVTLIRCICLDEDGCVLYLDELNGHHHLSNSYPTSDLFDLCTDISGTAYKLFRQLKNGRNRNTNISSCSASNFTRSKKVMFSKSIVELQKIGLITRVKNINLCPVGVKGNYLINPYYLHCEYYSAACNAWDTLEKPIAYRPIRLPPAI